MNGHKRGGTGMIRHYEGCEQRRTRMGRQQLRLRLPRLNVCVYNEFNEVALLLWRDFPL